MRPLVPKHSRRRRKDVVPRVPGTAPGTLHVNPEAPHPRVSVVAYGPEGHVEKTVSDLEEIRDLLKQWPVTWVNVDSLGDVRVVEKLGEIFGLHRLALEDVTHVQQRPKAEPYADHVYLVARMIEQQAPLGTEQLSLFLGRGWIVTFQERPGDCWDPVRARVREGRPRLRGTGPDYLAYALLDSVVDGYFPAIEALGEKLEELEELVVTKPSPRVARQVQQVRHDLLVLRRATWPLREALGLLQREVGDVVSHDTRVYLRDCQDHVIQVIDLIETYRELGSSLMDLYLSSISNRMNEIMKVLTIIATIFIPLSFVAGVYGMNFHTEVSPLNMPELKWYWGYPFALGIMTVMGLGMLAWFWRRGWLEDGDVQPPDARDRS